MSELKKSEKDSDSPCCSKSLQNVLSEGDVPIIVDTINNKDGIVNIGLINFLPTTQPKLMFQVKNPVHTFTGREEFLQELHDTVQKCKQEGSRVSIISQTSSISGLGGIGKTETVRMYIHKFSMDYDNVVWIDAENPSDAVYQFTTLAYNKLRINVKDHKGNPREFSHILEDVYRKLCQKPKQLLIVFDNAEALDDTDTHALGIRKLLPAQTITNEPPTVLITSRQQFWEDINVITLGLWKIEECIEFIYKRLHLRDSPENKIDATELAELFDRLPIALEVAVSVIAEQLRKRKVGGSGVYSINSLIAEYKAGDRKMLSKKTQQNSTQVTMQLLLNVSLNKIKAYEEGKLAIKILALMAYLSPTGMPKKMIHAVLRGTNEEELANALTLLTDYSIIRSDDSEFTIHRVFQDIVITILPSLQLQTRTEKEECVEDLNEMRVLNELTRQLLQYASDLPQADEHHDAVITNIVHTTDYIIQKAMTSSFYAFIESTAHLIRSFITHFEASIKLYRELVNFDKSKTGYPDQKTCHHLSAIASIYYQNGIYEKSLKTNDELLTHQLSVNTYTKHNYEIKKKNILIIQGNMVNSLVSLRKHDEALQLSYTLEKEQAKVLGPLHQQTLATKMNIATVLQGKGRIAEALQLYYTLEKDFEKVLGPSHQNTLLTKMNIAASLKAQGRLNEALQLYSILEQESEKVFGRLHKHTLTTKMNTANILYTKGKVDEALQLYYIVEKDQQKVLGPLHPDTLATKMNIANSLSVKGEIDEALQLYLSVEKDFTKVLGALQPDTLHTKRNIAYSLSEKGRMDEALQLYYAVEKDFEKVLGPLHPETLMTKRKIAYSLSKQGKIDEALKLYFVVEKDFSKVLGPLHPDTLRTIRSIAKNINKKGSLDDVLKVYNILEKYQEDIVGKLHPDTTRTILKILNDKGRIIEALQLYCIMEKYQEKSLGSLHPYTLVTKLSIANCLSKVGKEKEALTRNYVLQDDLCQVLGPVHRITLLVKMNIANSLSGLGKKKDALELYLTVLNAQHNTCGPVDLDTLATKANIAVCMRDLGNWKESLMQFYTVQNEHRKVFGDLHPTALIIKMNTANCLSDLGNFDEALNLYDAVDKEMEYVLGHLHPHSLLNKMNKAILLSDQGKKEESLTLYQFVLEEQEKIHGLLFPHTLVTKMNVAVCLSDLGKKEAALKLYYEVEEQQESVLGPEHPHTLLTLSNICNCLSDEDKEKSLRLYYVD